VGDVWYCDENDNGKNEYKVILMDPDVHLLAAWAAAAAMMAAPPIIACTIVL
jgi:hypothetical protein